MSFKNFCNQLEAKIESSYTEGLTMDQAEKLAGEFLHANIMLSKELQKSDLDSRMRKSGLKAIRAAIYMESASKPDKKPTEATLSALVDSNDIVIGEQTRFDESEVETLELRRLYDIFTNAHIHFRSVAKGNFNG